MDIQKYDSELSEEVKYLLSLAAVAAQSRGCSSIGSEHLLMAMLFNKQSRVCKLLSSADVTAEQINIANDIVLSSKIQFNDDTFEFQKDAILVIEEAIRIADVWNHEVTSVHFLMSILEHTNKGSKANLILESLKIDRIQLARRVINTLKLYKTKDPPIDDVYYNKEEIEPAYQLELKTSPLPEETEYEVTSPQIGSWFSKKTEEIIAEASSLANEQMVEFITDAHLFEALIKHNFIPSVENLKNLASVNELSKFFYRSNHWNTALGPWGSLFSTNTIDTLGNARKLMESLGKESITPDMLLISILKKEPTSQFDSYTNIAVQKNLFDFSSLDNSSDLAAFSDYVASTHANRLASTLLNKLSEPEQTVLAESVASDKENITRIFEKPETILVSIEVAKVFHKAHHEALKRNQPFVNTFHIFLSLISAAIETEVGFIKQRQQSIIDVLQSIAKQTDELELELPDELKSQPDLVNEVPFVSPEITNLVLEAYKVGKNLNSNCVDLNHLAIAILNSMPDKIAYTLLANNLKPPVIVRKLRSFQMWQPFQKTFSQQSIVVHLDKLDVYFKENILGVKRYSDQIVLNLLSDRSKLILCQITKEIRESEDSRAISIEDFVIGITLCPFLTAADILDKLGINFENIKNENRLIPPKGSIRCPAGQKLSYNSLRLLKISWEIALQFNVLVIEPEHILLAIAGEHSGIASNVIESLEINPEELKMEILKSIA